jgi:hypothetical protein
MTRKQKEDKVKEVERFINEGVPEEARDRENMWEKGPNIRICVMEPRQRINEKENKESLDAVGSKDAKPIRSDDATIRTTHDNAEKEEKQSGREKSGR